MLTKWSIQEFMTSCSYDDVRVVNCWNIHYKCFRKHVSYSFRQKYGLVR